MEIVAYYPAGGVDLFLKSKDHETVAYGLIAYNEYDGSKQSDVLAEELTKNINTWLKKNDARVKPENINQIIDKAIPRIHEAMC